MGIFLWNRAESTGCHYCFLHVFLEECLLIPGRRNTQSNQFRLFKCCLVECFTINDVSKHVPQAHVSQPNRSNTLRSENLPTQTQAHHVLQVLHYTLNHLAAYIFRPPSVENHALFKSIRTSLVNTL